MKKFCSKAYRCPTISINFSNKEHKLHRYYFFIINLIVPDNSDPDNNFVIHKELKKDLKNMQKNFIVHLFYIIERSLIIIHFYTTKKISSFTNFYYFDNINIVHNYDRDFIMII